MYAPTHRTCPSCGEADCDVIEPCPICGHVFDCPAVHLPVPVFQALRIYTAVVLVMVGIAALLHRL